MAQIFPTDFEEKLTMAQNDYILFSDSEDGNKIKKAQYKNLKGEQGNPGQDGQDGTAATIAVGTTSTLPAGSSATVTNSGTSSAAVFNFGIPKGDKGDTGDTGATGPGATVTVGTTTTGDAGTSASVTNSGTTSAAVFNFTIPKGDKGDTGSTGAAATIAAGTTTTLSPGSNATVTNTGTSSAAVFDFGIPQGATGATGNGIASITSSKSGKITTVTITETNSTVDTFQISDGADGQGSGDVIGPNSSTDGHLAVFDGNTGKIIKDGGSVPTPTTVVDSLDSTSTTSALSANQGKVLDGKIANLMGLGKFLSLWNATTGQPISFPLETPYTYTTGDYFLVETISTATPPVNYKPNGSSYTGTASSTTETDELEIGDIYIYDGTTWLLQLNHGKTVSFSEIAGNATDNTSLSNALAAKADDNAVVKLSGDQTIGGTKTFNTSPVVPNKTADATNTGTAIATEAQVYKKQDTLSLAVSPTQGNLVTWGADNKTLVDGGAIPTGVPSGGTDGQVLSKVSGSVAWANVSGGDVVVSSQANNILTSGMKIWAGTEANYQNLGVYDSNTLYLTV